MRVTPPPKPDGQLLTPLHDSLSTARLAHLETAPDLPGGAILDLVRAAVCEAADCGATAVLSDLPVPHGAVLGLRPAVEAAERLDTDLLVEDLDAATALA